jgi:hypothetical protein
VRKVLEERSELVGQERVRPRQGALAGARERQREPPPVLRPQLTLHQARVLERREQLRDGRPRDPGATRQLRPGDALALDRSEREVLRNGQRRVTLGEQPLDPSGGERRDRGERLNRLVSI